MLGFPTLEQPSPIDLIREAHITTEMHRWRGLQRYIQLNSLWYIVKDKLRPREGLWLAQITWNSGILNLSAPFPHITPTLLLGPQGVSSWMS